ncbi:MAG: sodium-translocating pyrophosphatase [Planctomycetales bacterium 4484_113]|nr:MAG: sodium-translocating pyrophosphatase [Planctomycetales bacterium 4484_113]
MIITLVIISALLALGVAAFLALRNARMDPGNEKMREISHAIQQGAIAFLRREYNYLLVFAAVVFLVLIFTPQLGWRTAISFLVGAFCSALAGYIGMRVATMSNSRTTQAARTSLPAALRVGFSAGAVTGLCVVGLGVLGISALFLIFTHGNIALFADALGRDILGFSLGASSIALFARVGGGIYTKAADVGADLVGKLEAGIPEDDPRNPAVIADNVGDNVGDVAGMGADLFESYVGSIISAMLLGFLALKIADGAIYPLIIAGIGIVASLIGIGWTNLFTSRNPHQALRNGTFAGAIVMIGGAVWVTLAMRDIPNGILWAIIAGLLAGILIGIFTEYYTSPTYAPTRQLAHTALTGPATNILGGFSLGMYSAVPSLLTVAAAIFVSFWVAGGFNSVLTGLFGIAIAAVGMLSTLGVTLAVDAYGPVADNAGGIAEMAGLPHEVREITDSLDAVGNTTAAIGKGFAIGSAALTALAFFAAFTSKAGITVLDLTRPVVIVGLFIGAMLPFLFSSLSLRAVGLAAQDMIEEVRRQFREIPGLLEGKARGNHMRCVDIATRGALHRMVAPGLLAVLAPIVVGVLFKYIRLLSGNPSAAGGPEAVGGLLAGAMASGVMIALFMANAGGAWDNAKKYIERGNLGGKGSEAHKAAIVGDTVGDPFKDTAGPSLNILLKLMSIVSLIFVVWFQ